MQLAHAPRAKSAIDWERMAEKNKGRSAKNCARRSIAAKLPATRFASA